MIGLADGVMVKPLSFKKEGMKIVSRSVSFKKGSCEAMPTPKSSPKIVLGHSFSFKNWEPEEKKSSEANDSSHIRDSDAENSACVMDRAGFDKAPLSPACRMISPRPKSELDAAAVQVQKVYRSYRTRRNLADCAIVVEELWWKENLNVESLKANELWWKTLDSAYLYLNSLSFPHDDKHETAVSRWSRAKKRLAKVGKGLSKDEKAQKLALQHWLEAIDPRHRYGHNLHIYYDIWFSSESTEPFFFWLDVGAGKEMNLEKCPRTRLHDQLITYLGPNERAAYEVIVESGKLLYRKSRSFVNTVEGSKWIFVLSTSRILYIGQKKKGKFQHSSFLAGAATTAAGRLVAKEGVLQAIWPYSGHYLPTEDNFMEFISFLEENKVDLTNVKKCSVDDDDYTSANNTSEVADLNNIESNPSAAAAPPFEFAKRLSRKWSTGTGARIGCVRDYPADLQAKALEHVNLSPRVVPSPMGCKIPIPSPRPSPNMRLSPGLSYMGIPSPRPSPNARLSPGASYIGIPSPRVKLTLPKLPTPKRR